MKLSNEEIDQKRGKVAEILLTARIQRGISQEELADIIGFKANTIKRIEQGRFSPNADQLYAICEALKIKIKLNEIDI